MLRLEWTRSVKGDLAAQVALGSGSYLAVNAQTPGGCSLMVWEADNNARQRWCTRLVQGGGLSSPLMDGFDNVYIGQPGLMQSFPLTQWVRWRQPVIGMPTTARILADGQLLVVTHLGQVLVFDAHRGTVEGTPLDLVSGVDPTDSQRGLADCRSARPRCPVAAAPAFAPSTGMIVLGLWEPGADAPILVGLRYHPRPAAAAHPGVDQRRRRRRGSGQPRAVRRRIDGVRQRARRTAVGAELCRRQAEMVCAAGLFGADPAVGFAGRPDRRRRRARAPSWSPSATPATAATWCGPATTSIPLSTSSQAGDDVGYTVARDGENGQALLVFDPADGHTVNSYPLPEATGWPVGVSVGHDRRVVTATSDGQVYGFAPD